MLQKIKVAMAQRDAGCHLSGLIELDEAYFGAPDPKGKGRRTKRAKALVAVSLSEEEKPRFAKIRLVKRLGGRCAMRFASQGIAPGSRVRPDGLAIYNRLASCYLHEPVVAKGKPRDENLHWAPIVISNAKVFIEGTFHGLDQKHWQRYLDEF